MNGAVTPFGPCSCQPIEWMRFVFRQTAQLFLFYVAFSKQASEHERKDGILVIVLFIDTFAALGQIVFQFPKVRREF
jgi:hypothetical protein